jgi:hypothetical protein
VSEQKRHEFYRSQLGKEWRVIPETYHPERGTWSGWSDNYVRVEFAGAMTLLQQPLQVRLISFNNDIMTGEVISAVEEHQWQGYIPLMV